MKKILIYIDSMAPAGGIERVISNLSNKWIEKYIVVLVVKDSGRVFYDLNNSIRINPLNLHFKLNMNSRISRAFSYLKSIFFSQVKLRKIIKYENPDYIYTSNPLNSFEIFLLGRRFQEKLIVSEHGSKYAYNKVYNFIKKLIYPKVYKLSIPTKLDTQLYIQDGYPAIYIPHLSTFEARRPNQLNSKIVLNIGRLTSDKQQMKLLEIWFKLKQKNKIGSWKLWIVGSGEEKVNLEKFIMENGLVDCVEILSPVKNVEEIFKQASMFAFTSRFEGFGMVLLEAMSFGIPCISFDCPSGPRDIINNGVNGALIPHNDVHSYEKELSILINNNKNYLDILGKNAFNTALNWDNQKILEKWDQLFEGEII